jgi:hypothetical protein
LQASTNHQEEEMSDINAVIDTYIEMWNETDPQQRRALIAGALTEDASYVDPLMCGEGAEGIDRMIAGAQEQYPGHRFTLLSPPEAHHDRVRFSWSLAANGGEPLAVGVDFATLAGDGRLRSVTGFLEPPA